MASQRMDRSPDGVPGAVLHKSSRCCPTQPRPSWGEMLYRYADRCDHPGNEAFSNSLILTSVRHGQDC